MAGRSDALPNILPLPEPLLAHHGKTIFGPMKEWVQAGRVPPVLLLTGVRGVGKREIAYYLSQWIFCESNPLSRLSQPDHEEDAFDLFGGSNQPPPSASPENLEPHPCGTCGACQRALRSSWVDFTEIPADEETGTLKIEPLRKLKASVGFGSHEGGYRITLIPDADRMTPQAANSVLKLLEEPPPGWIFFLTAGDPTLVLPTILSRCQTLRLKPLDRKNLELLLRDSGVPADRISICAELAHGSLTKALDFADDESWERRKSFFAFLIEPQSHVNDIQDWAAAEPAHLNLLVDQLESLTLDLARFSVSPKAARDANPEPHAWINRDGEKALMQHARTVIRVLGSVERAREFWLARAERLAQARDEALTPVNRKLLIQDLLLPWLEAVRK